MEFIAKAFHGPYGYLVIVQILTVAGLMLTLVWFMVRRTQAAFSTVISGVAPATVVDLSSSPEFVDATHRVAELEVELVRLKEVELGATDTASKIKFLESKLIEYQILEEEIAALGSLKVENKALREKLETLESKFAATNQPLATEAKVEAAAVKVSTPVPVATPVPEPVVAKAVAPELATPPPSTPAQSAPSVETKRTAVSQPESSTKTPKDESLDGLLGEIEKISQSSGRG